MLITEARLLEIIEEEYVNILLEEVQALGMPDNVKDLLKKREQAHSFAVQLASEIRNDPQLKSYLPSGYSLKSSYYEKSPLAKRLEKVPVLNNIVNLISKGKMKTKEEFIPNFGLVGLISSIMVDLEKTFAVNFNPADKDYKSYIKKALLDHFKGVEAISKEKSSQSSPQRTAGGEFPVVDKTINDPSSQPTQAARADELPDYKGADDETGTVNIRAPIPVAKAQKPDIKGPPSPPQRAAARAGAPLPPSWRAGMVDPKARMPSKLKVTAMSPGGEINFGDNEEGFANRERYPAEYAAYKTRRAGGVKSESKHSSKKIKVKIKIN